MSKATRRRRSDPSRVGPPRNARLRRIAITAAAAAVVTACGAEGEDSGREAIPAPTNAPSPQVQKMASPVPDLAVCPARTLLEEGLRERTEPIAVPAALRPVMRSGMDNFAFVTLAGATVCVDASWMEAIEKPALSPDGRFASFDWGGYEAFGHVIVDRVGKGQVLDTGVAPVASPSGRQFAAADLGEAGFGALNAFAVWRIAPSAVRELASHEDVPPAYDWRIDGWRGESCIDLSAVSWDTLSTNSEGPRQHYRARVRNGWRVEHGRCGAV